MMLDISIYGKIIPVHQDDYRRAYTDNMRGTGFGGKHAQDTSATTDVKNGLSLEKVWVIDDCRLI